MSTKKALRATAYHEAGHAVAVVMLDMDMEYVTIREEGDAAGHISYGKRMIAAYRRARKNHYSLTLHQRDFLERRLVAILAGSVAERKLTNRRNNLGAESDYQRAVDDADIVLGGNYDLVEHYLKWLFAQAEALVDSHWDRVEAVAEALLQRTTLTDSEVRNVMTASVDAAIDLMAERRNTQSANK